VSKQIAVVVPNDELVPDKKMRAELGGISATTIDRWEKDPRLSFPPKITIRRHSFRSRVALEEFKSRMVAEAVKHRSAQ
jgi:predicted DNA-binding transcriptional regulator AlpA